MLNDNLVVTELYFSPLRLRKWDLKLQSWSSDSLESQVVYRNTLYHAMEIGEGGGGEDPNEVFVIDASMYSEKEMEKALKTNLPEGAFLDGATGSRKNGYFLGSFKTKPSEYYFSGSKRISHYSMLWSNCASVWKLENLKLLILDDDQLQNQIEFGIGDCYGVMKEEVARSLSMGEEKNTFHQIQFRLGVSKEWIAKGTILPIPSESKLFKQSSSSSSLTNRDWMQADIILPKSSFKGNKPEIGKLLEIPISYFGVKEFSLRGKARSSHSFTGWFTSPESQEWLLNIANVKMREILDIRGDVKRLVELFIESRQYQNPEGEWENINLDEIDFQSQKDMQSLTYAHILKNDQYNQLLYHPKTQAWANAAMQKMVREVALGQFLKMPRLMANPLPILKKGIVLSYELPTGTYISGRYPLRHRGDIHLVQVINLFHCQRNPVLFSGSFLNKQYACTSYIEEIIKQEYKGTFWINPEYYLEAFSGDFDGDTSFFLNTAMPISCDLKTKKLNGYTEIPLAAEIESWSSMPTIEKPKKTPISGSLEAIAAKSAGNNVGLISWTITACRMFNISNKEFTNQILIAKLGQELQNEVDGLKSDCRADMSFVDDICKLALAYLYNKNEKLSYWLNFYRDKEVFDTCSLMSIGTDTISLLWNQTTKFWREGLGDNNPSPFKARPSWDFRYLMNWIDVPERFSEYAMQEYRRYKTLVKQAIQVYDQPHLSSSQKDQAFKDQMIRIFDSFKEKYDAVQEPERRQRLAAAFHNIFHAKQNYQVFDQDGNKNIETRNGTEKASLCFHVFSDVYLEALSQPRLKEFRLYTPDKPSLRFDSVVLPVKVIEHDSQYSDLALERDDNGELIGAIIVQNTSKNAPPPNPGLVVKVRILSVASKKNQSKISYHLCQVLN